MTPEPDDLLTTAQVARMLGTNRVHVWWLVLTGQLEPIVVHPDTPQVPDTAVDAWIDQHRPQPDQERL